MDDITLDAYNDANKMIQRSEEQLAKRTVERLRLDAQRQKKKSDFDRRTEEKLRNLLKQQVPTAEVCERVTEHEIQDNHPASDPEEIPAQPVHSDTNAVCSENNHAESVKGEKTGGTVVDENEDEIEVVETLLANTVEAALDEHAQTADPPSVVEEPALDVPPPSGDIDAPETTSKPAVGKALRPRDKFRKYVRYQLVNVYSGNRKCWIDDGIVVEVLDHDGTHDDLQLPAGSVKIQYNNQKTFKWLSPNQFPDFVRPSKRPRPPPTLAGELYKETHGLFTKKHVRYFDLSKGYLQWWHTLNDAKKGTKPHGQLCLAGMELKVQGTKFWIRTKNSQGVVYCFDATSPDAVQVWIEGLKKHEDFCSKLQDYFTKQVVETECVAN